MRRLTGVGAGLLGLLLVPLALAPTTSWLAVLGHLVLSGLCVGLAAWEGVAGRPGTARAWGAWSVLSTAGVAGALHVGWAEHGSWAWIGPFALLALWGWVPPVAAWGAGSLGARRQAGRARRAVLRRHRARAVVADQEPVASNSVG